MMRFFAILLLMLLTTSAQASAKLGELSDITIDHSENAVKEGAIIATQYCALCHSLRYIKYRHLKNIGFDDQEVDEIRGTRAKDDAILSYTTPEDANKIFGMVPPDLSLIAKARRGGPRYVYTYLTSYYADANKTVHNRFFPGTAMPDVMGMTTKAPQERVLKKSNQVSAFLEWTADPHAQERHTLGYYTIAYLIVLAGLLYLVHRRVWSRLKTP